MSKLKFFIEYHSGAREPKLEFWLNGAPLCVHREWQQQASPYQINAIECCDAVLATHNCLEIWQRDKTNQDLVNDQDHWCKIQEIEIDGILCQTALYRCSEFEHAMSEAWVKDMRAQGHDIPKIYRPGGTDIRLNGCCRMHFTTPVWQWYVTNYDNESTY